MWSYASHLGMDFQKCEVSLPHFHSALIAKYLKFWFFHTSTQPLFAKMWIYDSAQLISALSLKYVKFRFRISTLPWLPKIWSSAFSTLPPCLQLQRCKVTPPHFCSALTAQFCSLGSAVYSYIYFHTISCCLTWRISPSERRGILIRTQKSKPSSDWFYCWSSSKDFYLYPIRSVKVWCGEHVESSYRDTDVPCQWLSIKITRSYMLLSWLNVYVKEKVRVSVHSWKIMDTRPQSPKGAECHYFSGMDRYSDFLLLKIHLNIQLCIMTSLHRLTWIIYSWCCAKILKFYFFANSITLWEAHKNRNYTLHSGFKRARQTVHYFCVFWYTRSYIK